MKYCAACKQNKESNSFYKNSSRSDGLATQCTPCYKIANYGKILVCETCNATFSIKHRNVAGRKHLKCKSCISQLVANKNTNSNSYIFDHGYKREKGRGRMMHRTVIERALNRELLKEEIIHHIDGDKTNNDLTNLWLTNHSDHTKAHNSLERLGIELYKQGFIVFDRELGQYRLK